MSFYPNDGVVRVGRETKGRRGSGATVISGLPGSEDALKQIASKQKAQCGVGGTVKDRIVEIQGDQRDRLVKILSDAGYTVKKAGG